MTTAILRDAAARILMTLVSVLVAVPVRAATLEVTSVKKELRFGMDLTRESVAGLAFGAGLAGRPLENKTNAPLGVVLCLVMAPVTVLSAPLDILSAPFRRRTVVRGLLNGTVTDEAGIPLAGVVVRAQSKSGRRRCGESIGSACTDGDFKFAVFETRTDAAGRFRVPFSGSFVVEERFSMTLEPFAEFDIVREGGHIVTRSGGKELENLVLHANKSI